MVYSRHMLRNKKWLILAIIVSLFVGRTLLTNNHFHTHDDIQVYRVNEFAECLRNSQIPCRWSSNLGKGYGYPLFIFYPPIIYLVPSLFHLSGLSIVTSLNIFAYLMFPLAAYAMYQFAHSLSGNKKLSFLASVAYTMIPYHALNVFVRGVYAETLAWSLLPLILARIYSLMKTKSISYSTAILLTILLLTHNISAMLIYPVVILWAVLLVMKFKPHPRRIKLLIQNLLLPLGLSSFFLLPALIEKPLVQTESMTAGYYSYINHFISLKQIFISNFWGYGGSGFGTEFDGMSFMIGKPYWIIFLLTSGIMLYSWVRSRKKTIDPLGIFFITFAVLFTFLTHNRSTLIWTKIPLLQYVQFPWRFIGLAGAFMLMAIVYFVRKKGKRITTPIILLGATLLIISYSSLFKPEKYDNYVDQDYLDGSLTELQQQEHLFDYLPSVAHSVPDEFATTLLFKSFEVEILATTRSPHQFGLSINSPTDSLITLSVYDYPGWEISLDGEEIVHNVHPNYGFIQIDVSRGDHFIKGEFKETRVRQGANLITVLSFLYLLWLIYSKRKDNN